MIEFHFEAYSIFANPVYIMYAPLCIVICLKQNAVISQSAFHHMINTHNIYLRHLFIVVYTLLLCVCLLALVFILLCIL